MSIPEGSGRHFSGFANLDRGASGLRQCVAVDDRGLAASVYLEDVPPDGSNGSTKASDRYIELPFPSDITGLQPDRLLLGHGVGIHDGAPAAIDDALADSRRNAPGLFVKTLRSMLGR